MVVVIDSGPIIAQVSARDPLHADAVEMFRRLVSGEDGRLLLPDVVFIETLNYLRAKVRSRPMAERIGDIFLGRGPGSTGWQALRSSPEVIAEAYTLHIAQYDRGLSLTDCVLIAHAQNLNAKVATFDQAFDGIVPTVEA